MSRICITSLKRNILIGLLGAVVLAVCVTLFVLMIGVEANHYETEIMTGTPGLTDADGYTVYSAPGVCDVGLCGAPVIDGRDVYIYLTNPETNKVAIRIEFYTPLMVQQADGSFEPVPDKLLGGTAFIRPGEYVEIAQLRRKLKDDKTNVMMKISTLNMETRSSVGFFYVNTVFSKNPS